MSSQPHRCPSSMQIFLHRQFLYLWPLVPCWMHANTARTCYKWAQDRRLERTTVLRHRTNPMSIGYHCSTATNATKKMNSNWISILSKRSTRIPFRLCTYIDLSQLISSRCKYPNDRFYRRSAHFDKLLWITYDCHGSTVRCRNHGHLMKLCIRWPFHGIQFTFPVFVERRFAIELNWIRKCEFQKQKPNAYRYVIPGLKTNQSHVVDRMGIFIWIQFYWKYRIEIRSQSTPNTRINTTKSLYSFGIILLLPNVLQMIQIPKIKIEEKQHLKPTNWMINIWQ